MAQLPNQQGGLIDPAIQRYMQQQRTQQFFAKIAQMGQGTMAASMRGADIGPALAEGIGQASGGGGGGGVDDLLQMLKLQAAIAKHRGQQRKTFSRQALSTGQMPAGVDTNNIDWKTGRPVAASERAGLAAQAYPEAYGKALIQGEFGTPKYNAPMSVLGPDGKPQLVRFPQRAGAPVPVQGYRPYTKPGEGPALVQIANAYRGAMKQAGKPVSELKSLQWAKTSVGKSPKDTFVSIYTALVRGLMDPEEARTTADEITQYVANMQTGGARQPPAGVPAAVGPEGPAQATIPPGPYEQARDFLGFGGKANQPISPEAPVSARSQTRITIPLPPEQGGISIETMTKDEVIDQIYGGRELSQDEIDRLDARLRALGY